MKPQVTVLVGCAALLLAGSVPAQRCDFPADVCAKVRAHELSLLAGLKEVRYVLVGFFSDDEGKRGLEPPHDRDRRERLQTQIELELRRSGLFPRNIGAATDRDDVKWDDAPLLICQANLRSDAELYVEVVLQEQAILLRNGKQVTHKTYEDGQVVVPAGKSRGEQKAEQILAGIYRFCNDVMIANTPKP